ncbi:MAG: LysM peptidoglycan-binding domain-containing protein [Lachnospiraceae bacterium]|nr:LysM peptidoglycan-binding domain-containing protein [Lachnospiraceae bacterium]
MSKARRVELHIAYEHVDITDDITGDVNSFSYKDKASGESDEISLSIQDREKKWMSGLIPSKGDHISAVPRFFDWLGDGDCWEMYCGEFEVDDVSISGPPAVCGINAVSIPRSKAFNEEERTKNWENVTVQEVAEEIANRAGISLYYEADEIPIQSLEQDKQTDCKFLYSVCEQYGLAMKVFAEKIVIFNEAEYEEAEPVAVLRYEEFKKYTYNSTLAGTYTGAKISYTDPGTGEDHIVMVGDGNRIMEINQEADSAADAQRKAVAELNNANKKAVTFSGTLMARKELIAGSCINLEGFGIPDGKYYIDEVVTKIGANGTTQQSIETHKTGYRMDNATVLIEEQSAAESTGAGSAYTVARGDTLWTIADKLLGTPLRYAEIYELNQEVIENAARSRGKQSSSNGHWLYAGTNLQIPAAEGDEENA